MPLYLTPEQIQRFWARIDVRGPDDCWPWKAGLTEKSYGSIMFNYKNYRANRIAFFLTNGKFPEHQACHSCDNPPCCNPAHLFDGTPLANSQDSVAKGRSRVASKARPGELNGNVKLSAPDIEEIRRLYAAGGVSHRSLGALFQVPHSSIGRILRGQSWRHI